MSDLSKTLRNFVHTAATSDAVNAPVVRECSDDLDVIRQLAALMLSLQNGTPLLVALTLAFTAGVACGRTVPGPAMPSTAPRSEGHYDA